MFFMDCTKTLRLRIKDKHARVLCEMAREVNQVWNFCNETRACHQMGYRVEGFAAKIWGFQGGVCAPQPLEQEWGMAQGI